MSLSWLRLALPVAAAGTILISACGGTSTVASPPAPAAGNSSVGQAVPAVPAASVQKVNANTASIDQLQQAFQAAGIPNAARWAREVDEYRPYPIDDPSFAKLRAELAKYNPGQDVVDQIVATLTL